MGWVMYYGRFIPHQRVKSSAIRSTDASKSVVLRLNALERVDEELVKGNERVALSLVKDLQGKPDGLRCFGAARQVPQRLYTLDELKLNSIDTLSLLSPVDATLGQIERNLQLAAIFGGLSAYVGFDLNQLQVLFLSLGVLFLWTVDQVSFGGGVSNLFLDMIGHAVSPKYRNRVIQHEAGHFLIAYLLGVLPRGYTLSSLEALRKEGSLNVQAGTAFVDFEFLEEVNAGKVSAKTLNQFSCIALAGVATEYLLFGCSEGGLGDIRQVGFAFLGLKECELQDEFEWRWMMIHARDLEPLNPHLLACYHISKRSALDGLLKSLGFTQKKADFQVRWAVLNTILILRRHEGARSELAEAMASGSSVGHCIDTIERAIDSEDV